jgi:hypothetical protein
VQNIFILDKGGGFSVLEGQKSASGQQSVPEPAEQEPAAEPAAESAKSAKSEEKRKHEITRYLLRRTAKAVSIIAKTGRPMGGLRICTY